MWCNIICIGFVLEETAAKFVFVKGNKLDVLLDFIDADQLPVEYGGDHVNKI